MVKTSAEAYVRRIEFRAIGKADDESKLRELSKGMADCHNYVHSRQVAEAMKYLSKRKQEFEVVQ